MAYIYQITNIINGKQYIGKTEYLNPEKRFKEHLQEYKRSRSQSRPLYRAFKKYGEENFKFEVLEEVPSEEASEREIALIQEKETYGSKGYNATLGGDGKRYFPHSDEEVLATYKKEGEVRKTAELYNCSREVISRILKENGIEIQDGNRKGHFKSKKILVTFNNEEYLFNSVTEASLWVVEKKLTTAKPECVRRSISRVINGKRKTYLKLSWREI